MIGINKKQKPRIAFEEAMLSPGVIKAITYAANNPDIFDDDAEAYDNIVEAFQDHVPFETIDCNQWWFSHYWSSGHKCSKCLEICHAFQCGEPITDQQFEAIAQNMISGHDPDCNARNVHSFFGLRSSLSLYT